MLPSLLETRYLYRACRQVMHFVGPIWADGYNVVVRGCICKQSYAGVVVW